MLQVVSILPSNSVWAQLASPPRSKTSAVSLSALLYSCPLIFDNTACFFTKKISAFRKTLPQLHFLSICHLHTYLQLSSFFLPPSQTFLFSYFSSSSYTSMPLHTGFPLKWKPLFHCCHPSCESFLITQKQSRTCPLCALKLLYTFFCF